MFVVEDLLVEPKHDITIKEFNASEKHEDDAKHALNIILTLLTHDMQTNNLTDKDIIDHLHKIFWDHTHLERYETTKEILTHKVEIRTHMFKIIKLIKRIKSLSSLVTKKLTYDKKHNIRPYCFIST